jgi:hypothetical protein
MEADHCAICFSESNLQKCNKCTALYCKECSQIVKTKYSNVCSVCQQPCEAVKSITKVYPEPPPERMVMNRLFDRIDNFMHTPRQQSEPWCSFCCRPNRDSFLDTCEFECLCRCCCVDSHCWYWRCCCNNNWVQNVYLTLTTCAIIGPAVALIVCFT